MRDVYLWTAVLLGSSLLVAFVVIACVTWWLDWQSRRVRPSVRFVGPAIELPPARALNEPTQVLRFVGRATVPRRLTLPGLAILVDFIAREAAVRRALAYELTPAPIWSAVDGVFTAKGLRTA